MKACSSFVASLALLAFHLLPAITASELTPERHPLFSRTQQRRATTTITEGATSGNGLPYPPAGTDVPKQMPQAWIDAYNTAKAAGKIPNIPTTTLNADTGVPDYPAGSPVEQYCSWGLSKCNTGDIWLAPPGYAGVTMDDGPSLGTPDLVDYLQSKQQGSTHFLIGTAIMYNPDAMTKMAAATSPALHLGVHTFTHTLQTTKTDMEVLADLGWTMQLILDLTGKVPMYWRAPEGDVDARVRAVAREVLGLQHVMWDEDRDADDWCLRQGSGTADFLETCKDGVGKSYASVVAAETSWASSSKSKGFISLEHETTDQSVNAFKEYQAALASNSWKAVAVPDLQGLPYYQNQYSPDGKIEKATSILPVRTPFFVNDSSAPAGSSGAPDTSAFNDLKSGSSSSSNTTSAASTTKASTTSGRSSTGTRSSTTSPTASTASSGSNGAMSSGSSGLLSLAAPMALVLASIAW